MRKYLLFLVLCIGGISVANAQTIYYKYLYTVDKQTGMKKDPGNGTTGTYITFTNRSSVCYESNKDGTVYIAPGSYGVDQRLLVFRYEGERNGMYIYREGKVDFGNGLFLGGKSTYTFSTDYKRMNYNCASVGFLANDVLVYERSTPQEQQSAPSQLY